MPGKISYSFQDYSREKSSVQFDVATLTAGNIAGTVVAMDNLLAAIVAVQVEDCSQSKKLVAVDTPISKAPATDKAAQRETKWMVTLEDDTLHTLSRHEIPIADTQWVTANSDFMDLSAGVGQALKTAIEAIVNSPAGNSVSVASVQLVGKRL
jgi:hypothetical protein